MTLPVDCLRWAEKVRFDPKRLDELCIEMGDEGAERVIANALEQIAKTMEQIEVLMRQGDIDAIGRTCKSLSRIAGHIGMTTFACVARDVRYCAEARDHAGLAATYGRLSRISDHSVHAIWSLEDISG